MNAPEIQTPPGVEQAFRVLAPFLDLAEKDGGAALLSDAALGVWRDLQRDDAMMFANYRGVVRQRCGRTVVQLLDAAMGNDKPRLPQQDIETLRAVTLAEFLALDIPVPDPLLAPLFTRQSLSLVYSWRGVGKTWLALGCAYAVASGGKFLRWNAPEPRRVLYLDGEMPAAALQRRLASIAAGSEAEASADFFKLVTPDLCGGLVPDLATLEGQEAVDRLIADTGAEFIAVDNLSCWVRSGVENEAESWRVMAEWLLRHRSNGRAILLVHHAGKGGAQRGTSKKEDILDVSLDLRRPPTYGPEQGAAFAIEFKKARHLTGKDAESFEAALTIDENGAACWTMTAVKESTYDRVIELAALGLSQKEIAEELEINKSNVSRHWRKAVECGQITPRGRDQ